MKKRSKMLLSLFLSTIMVFSVVPSTVFAEPAHEETPAVQENTTEAVQDNTNTNEAEDPATEDSVTEDDATEATTDSSNTDNDAVAQTDNDENKVTISGITIQTPVIQFKGANAAVAEALTKDIKIDESDPAIQSLREALGDLEMVGGEAGTESNESNISTADLYEADEQAETKKLTADQINTVVGMYQQYLNQWSANANVLGVQNPFFLDFNDDTDGLGILGEMLALDGKSVQDVRDGKVSYDDLTGMIFTFTYGDKLGIKYYGPDVTNARDEALAAVTASGAQTKAQKLLVLNDWLAHNNTFDMSYIMNSGKESDDDKPMIAKDPQKQEHEDEVYNEIYKVYEPQIKQNFHDQIYAGIEKDLLVKFYKKAIAQTLVKAGQSEEDANAYVEANKEAIEKDPEAFVKENLPDAAEPLKQEADKFIKNAEEKGVEVSEGVTMTVEQLTQQQLDSATNQAATGMTTGVINYWEGTQFGAFGMGTSVCLGYSRAFSYLVQCLDKDIYLKDPSKGYDSKKTVTADDGTTSEVCDNWKTAKELYYGSDGKTLDINAGYTVDLVRISFQSNVTMYGEEQEDFGSDHYWNAVKVDGQWYYVDPCYTDVYTEVMSRDRVETDGDMNHVFFLFSDTDARKLYQGNFSVLRSLYQNEATDTTYEKAWMARAASNVYYADGYAYYMYDSTDLFDRVSSTSMNQSQKAAEYKIVRHKLTNKDTGDGDSDYETLINFTDKKNDDDDDTFVSVLNKDGKMEKNDLLTKLYAQFVDEQSIYPSIGLTAALYTDGKIYFNVSNDIVSYNPADGAVAVVKEYNTVSAKRDTTKLFGGMAFTTEQDKTGAEQDKTGAEQDETGTEQDEKPVVYTVKNHPIAGLTVKGDNLVVSIGTNFAFISGKSKLLDHSSYGYEFEETDYNPTYTNYKKYQQFMGSQSNDNDEFMWSANFVDTVDLKTLTGDSHNYKTVSVPATCGRNAFTEERCSDCGLIKDATRVEEEGTAHEHHYIKFHETYYTKDDNGNWNEADNYVCPECGACITEPVKSKYEQANSTYEKRKAIWDEAQKNAAEGHAYTATDAEWSDDHTSVTFQNLKCETCANQINKLDCLLESDENATNKANRDSIEKALAEKVTATAKLVSHTGTCDQGVTSTYKATGKTADGYRYTASDKKTSDAGQHQYTGTWAWEPVKDDNGNVTGYTASVTGVKCSVCDDEPKAEQITVADAVKDTEKSVAATCTEKGKDVYTATATVKDAEGKTEIGTLTDTYEVELAALEHKYGEPTWNWTKGENNTYTATATFTCANDEKHVETVDAKVTEKSDGATCTEAGKITYTATVTFEGKDYKGTKTEEVAALGHDYKVSEKDGWKWTADKEKGYTAVATFVCSRCKDSHDVTADVVKEDKNSQIIYTATAKYTDETGKEFTATATKSTKMSVSYKVHRQDYDWEKDWKKDGQTSGTVGEAKRLEAIEIKLPGGVSGSIEYRTHIQDIGWEKNWSKDGEKSGTEGQCKRLEAIQIRLTGEVAENYDVYYSVHAENFGWLGWAKNGEEAGTAGYGYRLEAIRIQLVTKGDKAPELIGTIKEAMKARLVGYQTHVQDYGTQAYVYDGATAGTEGECKRMESIRMKLPSSVNSSIQYRSHVQDIGWEKKWASNGSLSGTEGQCKRLEAIQIKLSGDVAENYDVYYRVHVQDYGWLAWAKNGESSGTEGYAKRLEAIEVRLVPKGTTPNLPASANEKAFIKK